MEITPSPNKTKYRTNTQSEIEIVIRKIAHLESLDK